MRRVLEVNDRLDKQSSDKLKWTFNAFKVTAAFRTRLLKAKSTFFSSFSYFCTKKMIQNHWKKIITTSFQVCKHPKAGLNTKQTNETTVCPQLVHE